MIKAEFFRKNNSYSGFRIGGHAGYSDSGSDIVCASVSSAVMLTVNTITDFFGIDAEVFADENVSLEISDFRKSSVEVADKLISSLITHLEAVSEEFPKTINITTTEV